MEKEGRTEASGRGGRSAPERLWPRDARMQHKWNDRVRKGIMGFCLKWNEARSRWNLIPRRRADRSGGGQDQNLLTTSV
ncbi:hypothetical protein CgunFtcFv8_008956 [Champsocephalus gunnari]|uniref:Uncharacterized protein n=1 Tax=Champsocephalus gunnari TaxID=52237 RepID=A0AAN8D2A2_CHAGU|nr:hypothetical protein CgunFtcFv8_008956 [Champsocephalus gunnari]